MLAITYNLDDATTKCYKGAFESYDTLTKYGDFTQDPEFLLSNMLYNFGYMYSAVKDLIVYFSGGTKTKAKTAFQAGYQAGQIMYYLLQENSVY